MKVKDISIRKKLIIMFILSILIVVGTVQGVIVYGWVKSAKESAENLSVEKSRETVNKIGELLEEPEHINKLNYRLLENGVIDVQNEQLRERFFTGILNGHSQEIYSIGYATIDGEYYGARRNEAGLLEIMKNNETTGYKTEYYSVDFNYLSDELIFTTDIFDPRTREWYKMVEDKDLGMYSTVYEHFVMGDLTISAGWPIRDGLGNLKGVLGTHMLLTQVDNSLKMVTAGTEGYAFVLEKDSGLLIGNSFGAKNFVISEEGQISRKSIEDTENRDMASIYNEFVEEGQENFSYKGDSGMYYVSTKNFKQDGINWLIVTAVPESLFLSNIYTSILNTVLIVLALIIASIIIYFNTTGRLMRPMDYLIQSMTETENGKEFKKVPIVRFDEIGKLTLFYNKMMVRLRDLVNNLDLKVQERTKELETAKDDLYLILDSAAEGIFGLDTKGVCTFCNASSVKMLGYGNQENLVGQKIHPLIHHSYADGSFRPETDCLISLTLETGEKVHQERDVFWKADGTFFEVSYYSYPQWKDGRLIGSVITFSDITQQLENASRIEYLGSHDTLTGLMNRRKMEAEFEKADTPENLPISVIFADINGLKLVNDIFGHKFGDRLIVTIADSIRSSCRETDIVARTGGDEFVVLLAGADEKQAGRIVENIVKKASTNNIQGVPCSVALGMSTKTDVYQNLEKVMGDAENEMYRNKSINKKTFADEALNTIIDLLMNKSIKEAGHANRVADMCETMAKKLKFSPPEIKKLRDAGFLHDIGKIAMEEELLNKEGIYSEEEKLIAREHAILGHRILNLFDKTLDLAPDVYAHHENWDGSGYPKGLKGEEIPVNARIIALVESYDRKLYRYEKQGKEEREKVLTDVEAMAGKRYDPELTKVFAEMVREGKVSNE